MSCRRCGDKLFHTRGPAALKLWSPKLLCVRGMKHVLTTGYQQKKTLGSVPFSGNFSKTTLLATVKILQWNISYHHYACTVHIPNDNCLIGHSKSDACQITFKYNHPITQIKTWKSPATRCDIKIMCSVWVIFYQCHIMPHINAPRNTPYRSFQRRATNSRQF